MQRIGFAPADDLSKPVLNFTATGTQALRRPRRPGFPAPATPAPTLSFMRLTFPLVGRQEELRLIEQAMGGREPASVVLAGAAGVGKSRLAREAIDRAAVRGLGTEWAVATYSARSIPFAALAHLMPRDLPEAGGQAGLFRRAAAALKQRFGQQRLVLGIDDAHLLDESSAALVRHLAASEGVAVVATVRSGEPAPDAVTSLWKEGLAERLEIRALSPDEVRQLVEAALGGQVDSVTMYQLLRATGGNALFLRELILGAIESGDLHQSGGLWQWAGPFTAPPRVAEMVQARLAALTPQDRANLEVLAVGEPLDLAIVEALVGLASLEAVESQGLLDITTNGRQAQVQLSHPLYAEVLRAGISPLRARALYRNLADALEAAPAAAGSDPLRLATWRLDGGGTPHPALMTTAAHRALALLDYPLAERLAKAAIGTGAYFEASLVLAGSMIGQGQFREAEQVLAGLERSGGTGAQRAQAAIARAENLFWHLGHPPAAEKAISQAEGTVAEPEWRDKLLTTRARFLVFEGRIAEALTTARSVLDRPGASEDAQLRAAIDAVWALLMSGQTEQACSLIDRMERLAAGRATEFPGGPYFVSADRWIADLFAGRLEAAAAGLTGWYHQKANEGPHPLRGVYALFLGVIARTQGQIQTAIRWLREAEQVSRGVDLFATLGNALAEQARCQALLGKAAEAEAALAGASAATPPFLALGNILIGQAQAWTAVARGEVSHGIGLALRTADNAGSRGLAVYQAEALHDVARLGRARRVASELTRLASKIDGVLAKEYAHHARALAARDPVKLSRVSAHFEEIGAVLYAAEAAAQAARLYQAQGRKGSALGCGTRAYALAQQCGGARTPALAGISAHLPLTRREQEIAILAATGLTNKDIAERLALSVRTIDNHLHSAYAKLGVSGRSELGSILTPAPPHRDNQP